MTSRLLSRDVATECTTPVKACKEVLPKDSPFDPLRFSLANPSVWELPLTHHPLASGRNSPPCQSRVY